jgi:hypothetical protein
MPRQRQMGTDNTACQIQNLGRMIILHLIKQKRQAQDLSFCFGGESEMKIELKKQLKK